jgi:hypothetical protein
MITAGYLTGFITYLLVLELQVSLVYGTGEGSSMKLKEAGSPAFYLSQFFPSGPLDLISSFSCNFIYFSRENLSITDCNV